jgi:hypothetical protein
MIKERMIFDFNNNDIRSIRENDNKDNLPKNLEFVDIEIDFNNLKVTKGSFVNEKLERFNSLLISDQLEFRKSQKGAPLSDKIGDKKVTILRAVNSRTNTFSPMDYVMTYQGGISPRIYGHVEGFLNGDKDLESEQEKLIGWLGSHASGMAVSYQDEHHIIVARVKASDVFEASNNGEYFYDGNNLEGKVVLSVDKTGFPQAIKKDRHESNMGL